MDAEGQTKEGTCLVEGDSGDRDVVTNLFGATCYSNHLFSHPLIGPSDNHERGNLRCVFREAALFSIVSMPVKWSCAFKAIVFPLIVKDWCGFFFPPALTPCCQIDHSEVLRST